MDIIYVYLYEVWLILVTYIALSLEYFRMKIIFENWLNGDAL